MGKVIAVCNQKGGTGKTTTSINLIASLEKRGANVLAVDGDTQGNFTDAMLSEVHEFDRSNGQTKYLKDFINGDASFEEVVQPVLIKTNSKRKPRRMNIDILPAAQEEGSKMFSNILLFKERLDEVKDKYDYIVIDFPPERPYADTEKGQFNMVAMALCCANEIITPCTADVDSVTGFTTLLQHANVIKEDYNHNLYRISFFLNNITDYKTDRDFLEYCESMAAYSGIWIPQSGLLKTSRVIDRPMAWYNSSSNVAKAYETLADYVMEK